MHTCTIITYKYYYYLISVTTLFFETCLAHSLENAFFHNSFVKSYIKPVTVANASNKLIFVFYVIHKIEQYLYLTRDINKCYNRNFRL